MQRGPYLVHVFITRLQKKERSSEIEFETSSKEIFVIASINCVIKPVTRTEPTFRKNTKDYDQFSQMRLRSRWKKYIRKPFTTARSMKLFWLTKMLSRRQVSQRVQQQQVWIDQINLRNELVSSLHISKTYQGILQHMMTRDQPPPQGLDERQFDGHDSKPPSGNGERQSNPILRNVGLCVVACIFLFAIGLAIRFHKEITMTLSTLAFSSHAGRVDQSNDGGRSLEQASIPDVAGDLEQQKQDKITAEAVLEAELAAERMVAKQKEKDDAEAHKKPRDAEQVAAGKKEKNAAAAADRQRQAIEQLDELPAAISLGKGIPVGLDDQKMLPVSIGNVAIDDLVDFELALAAPKDSGLNIVKGEADGDRSWVIEAMVVDLDAGKKQKTLAEIYFKKGDGEAAESELVIEPASAGVAKLREYKLLLRSALLLSATRPQEPQEQSIKQISLVAAVRGQSGSLITVKNQNTVEIELGVPRFLWSESANQTLVIDDLDIAIEVVAPCALNGQAQETTIAVTEKTEVPDQPAGDNRYRVPIFKHELFAIYLTLDAQLEKTNWAAVFCVR